MASVSKSFKKDSYVTKRYCPECGSFHIVRIRRGFFRKYILLMPPRYECRTCKMKFSRKQLNANAYIEDPFSGDSTG